MSEKKEYSRSIRMTNTIKEFVESQDGNGFNEKFENMVLLCMAKIPELDKEIKGKENKINELNSKIAKQQNIINQIDNLKWNVSQALEKAEKINKEIK